VASFLGNPVLNQIDVLSAYPIISADVSVLGVASWLNILSPSPILSADVSSLGIPVINQVDYFFATSILSGISIPGIAAFVNSLSAISILSWVSVSGNPDFQAFPDILISETTFTRVGEGVPVSVGDGIFGEKSPTNLIVPAISGTEKVGYLLSSSTGTWSGSPAFGYQWIWADTGAGISGATSSTYVPQSTDEGHTLAIKVTATNPYGSLSVTSRSTFFIPPVLIVVPVNSALPVITGTVSVGNTLTTTTGTWSGSPAFGYQWIWADTGAGISGATSSTYVPQSTDVGHTLAVIVRIINYPGAISVTSLPTSGVITSGVFWIGFNIEGMEGGGPYPGSLGTNYFTPSAAEGQLGQVKGMYAVRLPIQWEQAQPTLGGALNMTYIGQIQSAVGMLYSYGMKVMLDVHNFGGRVEGKIGGGTVTVDHFSGFWALMAAQFVGNPGILSYDIMNEWSNMPSSAICPEANQAAITAIGAVDPVVPIFVEGDNYSSAWSWRTYNEGLSTLMSAGNPLIFSAHIYFDHDDSGTNGNWDTDILVAGSAPPGLNLNTMIGVERITPFVNWCQTYGVQGNIGECGIPQGYGDNVNWATCATNMLTYLQGNDISIFFWAAGPAIGSYFMSLDPYLGQQSMSWPYIQAFTGSQDEPNLYFLSLGGPLNGLGPPTDAYCTIGVASAPFTIEYRGSITGLVVTPSDWGLGGTFTPSILTLSGINPIGTFTYTPVATASIQISATNNKGLVNPPAIGLSTLTDNFVGLGIAPTNVYGLYLLYTAYIGPVVRLQRAIDGAQMDFYFNSLGNLPRQAIQTWASSLSIQVVKIYDQSPAGNHIVFSAGVPTLTLSNAVGYPEINIPSGAHASFSTPSNGQTLQSILARFNQSSSSNTSSLLRQDWYTGPFGFGQTYWIYSTGYIGNAGKNGGPTGINVTVNVGVVLGEYHDYAGTYQSGVTNGIQTYVDGVPYAQGTCTYTLNAAYASNSTEIFYFEYGGAWIGQWQSTILFEGLALTEAQVQAFVSADTTYYSTPLPDSLSAVSPLITGTKAAQEAFSGYLSFPFAAVTISDTNSGVPTDSVMITLTGVGGTLAGTGLSGSGPYTISAASAAAITEILQSLNFTPSGTLGSTTNFELQVSSSSGTNAVDTTTSVVVTAYIADTPLVAPSGTFTPRNYFGVNIAGGEQSLTSIRPYGWDYIYPRALEINYYASLGMGLIRMPVASQRIYQIAYGPMNATQMGYMETAIQAAFAANMYVVIDPHDYGGVWDSRINGTRIIGVDAEGTRLFADMWSRLATIFKNYPNVIFGLENEPSKAGQTAALWVGGAASAVAAIRAAGATQLITLPGVNWTNAYSFVSNGSAAAWLSQIAAGIDPLNNFVFEVHDYMDSDSSGTHPACDITVGTTRLTAVTAWAAANGVKLWLGECGWSPDPYNSTVTNCLSQSELVMAYLNANQAQWLGMAYFNGGSWLYYMGYMYFCGPVGMPNNSYAGPYTQSQQMTTLLEYMW